MVNYIAELVFQEYFMLKYLPSMVAASAVYLTLKLMPSGGGWSQTMQRYTHYSEAALQGCTNDLFGPLKVASGSPQLQVVKKQYSHPKFHEVATTDVVVHEEIKHVSGFTTC
jgi:hypothetical protein|eukprot:COSAG01_NODE_6824_length_3482_cov_5.154597_2_plen_112_part_00